jgi:hypothetical protein
MDALACKQVIERLSKAADHLDDLSGDMVDSYHYIMTLIIEAYLFDACRLVEESARPVRVAVSPFVPCEYHR